jgi:putative oxidoreductase
MSVIATATTLIRPALRGLDLLQPLFALGVRLYVANIFWKSGLTKIQSWDSTVMLFTHEYHVPLLSPGVAAFLGTGVELVFPLLLALGLGGRLSAAVLFVFNIIAVISYPDLNEIGVKDHFYWGVLLLVPLLYGPGKLSIDCWLRRRYMP